MSATPANWVIRCCWIGGRPCRSFFQSFAETDPDKKPCASFCRFAGIALIIVLASAAAVLDASNVEMRTWPPWVCAATARVSISSVPVSPRRPRFWEMSLDDRPRASISLTASLLGFCSDRMVFARSWVACWADMFWLVMVATAPPIWSKLMPAAAASGATLPSEEARSCIRMSPAPTAAIRPFIMFVAWPPDIR